MLISEMVLCLRLTIPITIIEIRMLHLNEYRFLEADLSYNKEGSKWEFGIGVTNLFNDTSINRDSFNELYSETRSYVIQPRYTVFRIKYDLTALN